jgi:hypothetical protein
MLTSLGCIGEQQVFLRPANKTITQYLSVDKWKIIFRGFYDVYVDSLFLAILRQVLALILEKSSYLIQNVKQCKKLYPLLKYWVIIIIRSWGNAY